MVQQYKLFYLDGASATGKTTLANYYRKNHNADLFIVPDVARQFYLSHPMPQEKHHTLATQKLIQQAFIDHVSKALMQEKSILVDSSPFTSIGYASLVSREAVDELLANVKDFAVQDALFIIPNPHDIDYVYDPSDIVRTETEAERLQVHKYLLDLYLRLGFSHKIISGTIEERIKQVNKIIF